MSFQNMLDISTLLISDVSFYYVFIHWKTIAKEKTKLENVKRMVLAHITIFLEELVLHTEYQKLC